MQKETIVELTLFQDYKDDYNWDNDGDDSDEDCIYDNFDGDVFPAQDEGDYDETYEYVSDNHDSDEDCIYDNFDGDVFPAQDEGDYDETA